MEEKTLVVFNFDQTLIEGQSDIAVLSLRPKIERFLRDRAIAGKSGCWAESMQEGLEMIHKDGVTPDMIRERLKIMPLLPHMREAMLFLKTLPFVDVLMMTESNQVFVEVTLAHHGLTEVFKRLYTNPSHFDDEGILRMKYSTDTGHRCENYCTEELCKSVDLKRYKEESEAAGLRYSKVLYIGDGRGDFCPCLKVLTEVDVAMPRYGHSLLDMLTGEYGAARFNAKMFSWKDGEDLVKYFKDLKAPGATE